MRQFAEPTSSVIPNGVAVSAALGFREIISQSGWCREKQTVIWFMFFPQMFSCFLSHMQIVQLIKENIAVDFFGEAFSGCEIWEQDCISPWYERETALSCIYRSSQFWHQYPLQSATSVFHCFSHQGIKESLEESASFVIQVSQISQQLQLFPHPDASLKSHPERVKIFFEDLSLLPLFHPQAQFELSIECLIHKCSGGIIWMRSFPSLSFLSSPFFSPHWSDRIWWEKIVSELVTSATSFVTLTRLINLSGPLFFSPVKVVMITWEQMEQCI